MADLAEHRRGTRRFDSAAHFAAAVRRAFDAPEVPAVPEWEPLAALQERLLPAVHRILDDHPGRDVVLVGHGTAWTVLWAALTDRAADLDAWASLRLPDVWTLTPADSGRWRSECDTGASHV